MDIKKLFGNRLKKIRLEKGLTQEILAEKLNVSAKSLSQIELGNNFVSAQTLDAICEALSITPKYLFDFEVLSANEEKQLSQIVSKLQNNPKLIETIKKIVNALG